MKLRRYVLHAGEAIVVCVGLLTVPWLPRRCVLGLAHGIGALACLCSRSRRKVALANLEAVYGESMPHPDRIVLLKRMFQHMVLLAFDLFWFSVFTRRRIARWVEFDESFDAFWTTSPSIMVGGHIGNWEALGLAVAVRGAPTTAVVAELKNPVSDRVLNMCRRVGGTRVVEKTSAVRRMLRGLRAGERIVLLLDQNTPPDDGGVFVDFLVCPFLHPVWLRSSLSTAMSRSRCSAALRNLTGATARCCSRFRCPILRLVSRAS